MERWHGKIAVVTGASSGIGVALAKKLVQHGLIVVGLARTVDKMKRKMKGVKGPGKFHAKQCDISVENDVFEALYWIKSTYKTVNVLVNNAAKSIENSSTEEIENVFEVNVFGLWNFTTIFIELMKENQTEAHIINVNSILGHRIIPTFPVSKIFVTMMSEKLINDISNSKIRVTNVNPGAVKTDMSATTVADTNSPSFQHILALHAEDVANSIVHALAAPPNVEINEITLTPKQV